MNDELTGILIIGDGGLHLHGVVTIAELGETETSDSLKSIDLIEQIVVTTVVKSEASATEKIHLNGVLNGLCGINKTHELVRAEDVVRVSIELLD